MRLTDFVFGSEEKDGFTRNILGSDILVTWEEGVVVVEGQV